MDFLEGIAVDDAHLDQDLPELASAIRTLARQRGLQGFRLEKAKLDERFAHAQAWFYLLVRKGFFELLGGDVSLREEVIAQHQLAHLLLLFDGNLELFLTDDMFLNQEPPDRVADLEIRDSVIGNEGADDLVRLPLVVEKQASGQFRGAHRFSGGDL